MYQITATLVHHTTDDVGVSSDVIHQIPTFYLDEDVLGIVSDQHAEVIARKIICPVNLQHESVTVNVFVERV